MFVFQKPPQNHILNVSTHIKRQPLKRTLTILMILSSLYSFADLGYCFKYKSNFILTNGTTITGYFYWGGFDYENRNVSTLDSILSVNFLSTDSVTVYTELYQLTSLSRCQKHGLQCLLHQVRFIYIIKK